MSEEILNEQSVSQQENVDSGANYIEAIKEMKAKTVSKEAYVKLQEENKQLLNSLINSNQVEVVKQEPEVDVNEIRQKLYGKDRTELSNLDYISNALKLRKALIEQGKPDPIIPFGHQISPTREDIDIANKFAEAIESCIEYADGDSEVFTNELMRITVDSAPHFKYKRR